MPRRSNFWRACWAVALAGHSLPTYASELQVLSVGDGDTLRVSQDSRRLTVRLACIDAPETAQAPFGDQAKRTLQGLAPVGSPVRLLGSKKDRYGRTVSEVFRGNTNVNLELVRRGQAFVYRQYLQDCDRNAYLKAEEEARTSGSGIWSVKGGLTRPWDWRKGRAGRTGSSSVTAPSKPERYRCSEVGSWSTAQQLLKQGHTYLDGDRDGEACESLR